MKLSQIVKLLESREIDEFMLIIRLIGTVDDKWKEEIQTYLKRNKDKLFIGRINKGEWKVIIANKGCDIIANTRIDRYLH